MNLPALLVCPKSLGEAINIIPFTCNHMMIWDADFAPLTTSRTVPSAPTNSSDDFLPQEFCTGRHFWVFPYMAPPRVEDSEWGSYLPTPPPPCRRLLPKPLPPSPPMFA